MPSASRCHVYNITCSDTPSWAGGSLPSKAAESIRNRFTHSPLEGDIYQSTWSSLFLKKFRAGRFDVTYIQR